MEFDRLVHHFKNAGVVFPVVIIDVGANKGQWFSECRKHFKCSMHLFDADKDNYEDLHDEVIKSREKYGSFPTPITIALLGEEKGKKVKFYKTQGDNNTGNSIYLENTKYFDNHYVEELETDTLDNLIGDKYDKIDLLKIDVQGAELNVLSGAKEKVLPKCDLILMEVSFLEYNKGAPLVKDVINFMDELGYQAIDIIGKNYFAYDFIQADMLFAKKGCKFIINKFE